MRFVALDLWLHMSGALICDFMSFDFENMKIQFCLLYDFCL